MGQLCRGRRAKGTLILSLVVAIILTMSAVPAGAARAKRFIALFNGGQEVPPTESNAFGIGFMTFDDKTKLLCYAITVSDGLGGETAAHFHAPADPGQNADIVFPITPVPGRSKTGCVGPILNGKQRSALKKGRFYANIHTQQFPAGEVRGQVLPIR
jgi:hypothetical protein